MQTNKIITDCSIGKDTLIYDFVNLYGCVIGDNCQVGPFVEIQKGVIIGNKVKIQSHSFICDGVTISDNVFIGHGVMFINDKYPKSPNDDWTKLKTHVDKNVSI